MARLYPAAARRAPASAAAPCHRRRFVLLYDPEEPDAWGGPFRVICYAQAPLETDIGVDPDKPNPVGE